MGDEAWCTVRVKARNSYSDYCVAEIGTNSCWNCSDNWGSLTLESWRNGNVTADHSETRMPSNLRPTTRECVYVVTRNHFLSCDKDGGETTQSAISENPMLHANLKGLCFIETRLLPIKVLHCGNRDFRPFWSCDLALDLMTFIYQDDPYSLETYRMSENELPGSRLSKVIF